ncbi:hypothetical protein S40288_11805 [Stachybotrys chartarum IBT 40288]|nr:hypothetical protein S40288_11805 [Stachybotrys chartarum IBT 40288]
MANLAFTYWSQDRYTEALNLMSQCIKRQAVKLGVAHPAYRNNAAALARWEPELAGTDVGVFLVELARNSGRIVCTPREAFYMSTILSMDQV